jgi:4-amino-4-deoxy-L-arabinose transferase-like glycosyltransferase
MKKIWWVLLLCLFIRLIGLNQSLWLDEAISANVVKNYSYSEIINKFSPNDFHPPLYYLTLKSWTNIFGFSEISLRMPSVIFALITVYIVYLLGGPSTGSGWTAMLAGLNPLLVYYSQEARMYSMVTMLLTLTLYFLVKKKYFWVSFLAGLSFLTFYGTVFMLAAMTIYLFFNKKYKEIILVNIGPAIALILVWPLMKLQLHNSGEMLSQVANWSLVLGKANLKNLLLIPMKFASGRISFEPKIVYYLLSGSFSLYVFSRLIKRNIYSFVFWMTLIVGVVFSIFTPMLQYFRFLYLIPVMALVINKNTKIMIGFAIFSLFYLFNTNTWREDWKSLVPNLPDKVYMISSFADPIKYYSNAKVVDIREKIVDKEITVVPYGEAIHGFDHSKYLTSLGYKKTSEKDFREVTMENWQLIY